MYEALLSKALITTLFFTSGLTNPPQTSNESTLLVPTDTAYCIQEIPCSHLAASEDFTCTSHIITTAIIELTDGLFDLQTPLTKH